VVGGGHGGLHRLRFETFDEGICVQTLHVGSYDDEAGVLDELQPVGSAR
jgi:hypothetical protein